MNCRNLDGQCGKSWCNCEEKIKTDSDRISATSLIREVMSWHCDPKSPEYNECDITPCRWCEQAQKVLQEMSRNNEV